MVVDDDADWVPSAERRPEPNVDGAMYGGGPPTGALGTSRVNAGLILVPLMCCRPFSSDCERWRVEARATLRFASAA